ncbi:hypothetical protein A2U01_0056821, partial [Trifolium medium]|nr:hypothetical protein [Trifolium medium]
MGGSTARPTRALAQAL